MSRYIKIIGILLIALLFTSCTYYSVCGETQGDISQKKDRQVEVDPETTIRLPMI